MDVDEIRMKFGAAYRANERTYRMGLDCRFAAHFAERFRGKVVLETCGGGGFTTIALARVARHVFSVDIDGTVQEDARHNVSLAGVAAAVTFLRSDAFEVDLRSLSPRVESAFLDPDWADSGASHRYRFIESTTRPPSDTLLEHVMSFTANVTLIQPPFIPELAFSRLPRHETEYLYLDGAHELYGLHFGSLARRVGRTEFRI